MDFESLVAAGSALGTGAVIVLDETTCMVDVALRAARFFAHESCGRCTPCRVGSQRAMEILERIEAGRGTPADLMLLESLCQGIAGNSFCPLGDAIVSAVGGILRRFRPEFEQHIAEGRCSLARAA